jgi:hypothetical protein
MSDDLIDQAKEMSIEPNRYAPSEARRMLGRLIAEVKRLQEDNAAKDDYLAQRLMTLNMHHNNLKAAMQQVTKLDGELARWREIAIRERSFNLDETRQVPYVAGENDLDRRERAKQMAAKELDLQIIQEDLKRLEEAFLETTRQVVYSNFGMDGIERPEGEEAYAENVAQAALTKIRAVEYDARDISPQDCCP